MRRQGKRKIKIGVLLSLACTLLAAQPVYGTDWDYVGEVDPFTGLPKDTPLDQSVRVQLGDNMYYDRELGMFAYPISGTENAEIDATVADGMVTTDPVSVTIPEGTSCTLYRNGDALSAIDFTNITEAGKYVLSLPSENGQLDKILSFTVVGEQTCLLSEYSMPDGFKITGATCDEEEVEWNENYVSLDKEGFYCITYECPKTGFYYELATTVDRTAPALKLENVKNGKAKGPVDISDVEDGAAVRIALDGKEINDSKVLNQSGNYKILLSDPAGNTTTYNFTILVYFDTNSMAVAGVMVLLVIALIVYLMLVRKHLKVR